MFFQARTELSGEAGRHVLSLDCTKSKGESRSNEHYKRKKASRVKGCELVKSFARYEVVTSHEERKNIFFLDET